MKSTRRRKPKYCIQPVVRNEPKTWVAAIWAALDLIDWNSEDVTGWQEFKHYPPGFEDEVKTAMAWIAEALGIDPATV